MRYLAAKAERDGKVAERKRKLAEEAKEKERIAKKAKVDEDARHEMHRKETQVKALNVMVSQMNASMMAEYRQRYGDEAEKHLHADLQHQERQAVLEAKKQQEQQKFLQKLNGDESFGLVGNGVFKDDYDARY